MIDKNRDEQKPNDATAAKTPARTVSADDAPDENDSSLASLVSAEQTHARERAREELGREPTKEEADKWLDAHTEGY